MLPFLVEYLGEEYEGLFIVYPTRQITLARPITRKGSTSVWTTRTCFCRRFKEFP
jgi:hypothetical protein